MSLHFLKFNLALLLLSGLALSASAATPTDEKRAMSSSKPTVISLKYHQPLTLAGEALTVEVVEIHDSRCPPGARCVWAGQATVSLKVSPKGQPEVTLLLGTSAPPAMNLPSDASFGAYQFSLISLEPRPSTAEAIKPETYEIQVSILKSHGQKTSKTPAQAQVQQQP